jgi:hypothetical protein
MEVLHPHCAGLDVHKDSVVACVRHMVDGDVRREVRSFKTTTKLSTVRSVPREIPPRRLARELLADNVEVALDRGKAAFSIDLAQGERVFGVVGYAP